MKKILQRIKHSAFEGEQFFCFIIKHSILQNWRNLFVDNLHLISCPSVPHGKLVSVRDFSIYSTLKMIGYVDWNWTDLLYFADYKKVLWETTFLARSSFLRKQFSLFLFFTFFFLNYFYFQFLSQNKKSPLDKSGFILCQFPSVKINVSTHFEQNFKALRITFCL